MDHKKRNTHTNKINLFELEIEVKNMYFQI